MPYSISIVIRYPGRVSRFWVPIGPDLLHYKKVLSWKKQIFYPLFIKDLIPIIKKNACSKNRPNWTILTRHLYFGASKSSTPQHTGHTKNLWFSSRNGEKFVQKASMSAFISLLPDITSMNFFLSGASFIASCYTGL